MILSIVGRDLTQEHRPLFQDCVPGQAADGKGILEPLHSQLCRHCTRELLHCFRDVGPHQSCVCVSVCVCVEGKVCTLLNTVWQYVLVACV